MYKAIMKEFPNNISYAIAYGSSVMKQTGYKGSLIDLIFCIPDNKQQQWHNQNIIRYPHHYSFLRMGGARLITEYQQLAAAVYCNTLVSMNISGQSVNLKYGVVSESALLEDLLDWEHLYLAGRFQKPVLQLMDPPSSRFQTALSFNLSSALRASLLLLPEKFSSFDLFRTIASLSYSGDFRMIFGENKNKIDNIVTGQADEFAKLYEPVIAAEPDQINKIDCTDDYRQDKSPKSNLFHLCRLPGAARRAVEAKAYAFRTSSNENTNVEDKLQKLAESSECSKVVAAALSSIVWKSSVKQSIKNILSAGPLKSIVYASEKAKKTFQS